MDLQNNIFFSSPFGISMPEQRVSDMQTVQNMGINMGSAVDNRMAKLQDPVKSFTFDIPSLPPVLTSPTPDGTATPVSVATPRTVPNSQVQGWVQGLPPTLKPSSDLSPRSHFSGNNGAGLYRSQAPTPTGSAPAAPMEDMDLGSNASLQELELLLNLIQQAQFMQSSDVANSNTPMFPQESMNYSSIASTTAPSMNMDFGTSLVPQDQKMKTEICRLWEKDGWCKFGDGCHFAHGAQELKTAVRHPKYKTKLCRNYSQTGSCQYGQRCQFIHQMVVPNSAPIPNIPDIKQLSTNISEEELAQMLTVSQMFSGLNF
eukprot:TRINITY_DN2596_c0_g1_i5.p2 TRINITY_DN2596_c0_g1~~TRINITY_DN2596_c0_g1_i5.p2  ORF type:complete len:316 (+),score=34.47 TRINITY_DN2596_c0_g1_i5:2155-3102(+)